MENVSLLKCDTKDLSEVRVIQRNLVYAIGIPVKYGCEDLLRTHEFFGQFGSIKKLVLKSRSCTNESTTSAYITFSDEKEALQCISEVDESLLDGKIVKCTYGTTKYCSFFLKNMICQNTECMYLHKIGRIQDHLTKDEMNNTKNKLHNTKPQNRNKEKIGKNLSIANKLKNLFQYKHEIEYSVPHRINFHPV